MTDQPDRDRYDVIVVGARCAGAATARLLAAQGPRRRSWWTAPPCPSDTALHPRPGPRRRRPARPAGVCWTTCSRPAPRPSATVAFDGPSAPRSSAGQGPRRRRLAARAAALRRSDSLLARRGRRSRRDGPDSASPSTGVLRDDRGRVARRRLLAPRGGVPFRLRARHVVGADGLRSTIAALVRRRHAQLSFHTRRLACSTPTSTGSPGAASSSTSHPERSRACSRPTTARPACGCRGRTGCTARSGTPGGIAPSALDRRCCTDVAPGLGERVARRPVTSPVRGFVAPPNYVRQASGRAGRWSATPATTATRSPGTASPTPSATPSSSRDALDATLARRPCPRRRHWRRTSAQRDRALRDTFRLTRALAGFPHPTASSSCRSSSARPSIVRRPSSPRARHPPGCRDAPTA